MQHTAARHHTDHAAIAPAFKRYGRRCRKAASDKRQLAAIEKNRAAERAASGREQGRHKPDKAALAHKKKCTLLGLEKKWSAEDADAVTSTVSAKSQDLRKTARRKAERYETECAPAR